MSIPKTAITPRKRPVVRMNQLRKLLDSIDELPAKHSHLFIDDGIIEDIVNQYIKRLDDAIDYGDTPIGRLVDSVDHIVLRAIINLLVRSKLLGR